MTENYDDKTGQSAMARAPKYLLPTIQLQGSDQKRKANNPVPAGEWKLTHTEAEKQAGESYAIESLGKDIEVVILKIRRKLSWYRKLGGKEDVISTNEHNTLYDTVTLFGLEGGSRVGKASDFRKEFEKLKTQQVLYVYVPKIKRICRLIIKGSQLGSQTAVEGKVAFYEYLAKVNEAKVHVHAIMTRISSMPEDDYFTCTFSMGQPLTPTKLKQSEAWVDEVHEKVSVVDAWYKARQDREVPPTAAAKDDLPVIDAGDDEVPVDYPQEDINPDDIPF